MKALKHLLFAFFAFTIVVGCGGEEKKTEDTKKIKIGVKKEIKKKEDNVANVVLTANDSMQYNKKEIIVKSGQKVRLTLRHIGRMNINEMGHNFILLKKNVNIDEFVAKAATEQANGYIPKNSPDIIANTKLIGGGEITVIEFDAPEAGVYQFLCSFPAHSVTMRGKFIVE